MLQETVAWLNGRLQRIAQSRKPDFTIGDDVQPYLQRWFLIPRNRFFNIYLHKFLRSDQDGALHDHMYFNLSILTENDYVEHTILYGGVHKRVLRRAGTLSGIKVRSPWAAHRVELQKVLTKFNGDRDGGPITLENMEAEMREIPTWSLFITGPRIKSWGFHCPSGWIDQKQFLQPGNYGDGNRGCD